LVASSGPVPVILANQRPEGTWVKTGKWIILRALRVLDLNT
jgi:hypothetical protein